MNGIGVPCSVMWAYNYALGCHFAASSGLVQNHTRYTHILGTVAWYHQMNWLIYIKLCMSHLY